jgi:septum site-determining protein MinC
VDDNDEKDKKFQNALEAAQKNYTTETDSGQFYKGTLRSGQVLESEGSLIVLGDVNPGGRIIAAGNVIVLGSLRGNVVAGVNGNENCFVVALEMNPMQIKIGEIIARSSDSAPKKKGKIKGVEPKIAYVEEGNIYIEDLEQEVLEDIRIN